MHVAAAGAAWRRLGRTGGPAPGTGAGLSRRRARARVGANRGDQPAAQPRAAAAAKPPEPDQLPADLIQAGAHPGPGLDLETYQLLRQPRLPAEHPHQVGAGDTVAPADGRGTNSPPPPALIGRRRAPPGRRRAPSRPVPSRRSGHYHHRLPLRKRAQRSCGQRAGQAGHCAGGGDQRTAARRARWRLATAPRPPRRRPARRFARRPSRWRPAAAGRDRHGRVIAWSFLRRGHPKPEGQRRLTSGMAPCRSRQAQRPFIFIASPWNRVKIT